MPEDAAVRRVWASAILHRGLRWDFLSFFFLEDSQLVTQHLAFQYSNAPVNQHPRAINWLGSSINPWRAVCWLVFQSQHYRTGRGKSRSRWYRCSRWKSPFPEEKPFCCVSYRSCKLTITQTKLFFLIK